VADKEEDEDEDEDEEEEEEDADAADDKVEDSETKADAEWTPSP
jgi:hypothetical protein